MKTQSKDFAPIALFVYNRPHHTNQTLLALVANEGSSEHLLYVFVDGVSKEEDREFCENVLDVLDKFKGFFKKMKVVKRSKNLGVDDSIYQGVSEVLNIHEKVIVLEDDIVTAKGFLSFMNHYLCEYENDDSIYSICGFAFPLGISDFEVVKTLGVTGIWGWATWSRAWSGFVRDGSLYYNRLLNLSPKGIDRFNFFGGYNYEKFLQQNANTENDCWDIQWYAYTYTEGKFCLCPTKSLVINIGHDGTGVHSEFSDKFNTKLYQGQLSFGSVYNDSVYVRKISSHLTRKGQPSFLKMIFQKIRSFFNYDNSNS